MAFKSPVTYALMPFIDNWEMTLDAATDVLAQTDPWLRLILVDNGSDETTRRKLHSWFGQLSIQNFGRTDIWHGHFDSLAACWNRLLHHCWGHGADKVWVLNNDVRLAPWTYELLDLVQRRTDAWFVSGVSVGYMAQMELYVEQGRAQAVGALGQITDARADGRTPEGISYGGPDFSNFLITRECHRWFQFDENFRPAYHEDNDYHRRLQLAGLGGRIFGVNLPFLHFGSATIKRSEEARAAFAPLFAACQQYYIEKWGGLPAHETFPMPFNSNGIDDNNPIGRVAFTGQGRPDNFIADITDLPTS